MKTYKLETDFGKYNVCINLDKYVANEALAIELIDCDDGETIDVITVCLPDADNAVREFTYIDVNNCPWAEKFIRDNNLGSYAGYLEFSGYCMYPLYKMDLDKLQE